MKINKTVLLLHGWPQPINLKSSNNLFLDYFNSRGYQILAPKLFTRAFKLNSTETVRFLIKFLDGKKPDVIVGISLGGLIAPQIAERYPFAKLILVASGSKLQPDSEIFNIVLSLAKNKKLLNIFYFIRFLPSRFLFKLYEIINPYHGLKESKIVYSRDMKLNFKYMFKIPITEESEILNFVAQTDNSILLRKINNQTLLFTSANDRMMPGGKSLKKLLANAKSIETGGGHFEVFTKSNYSDLDLFLNN